MSVPSQGRPQGQPELMRSLEGFKLKIYNFQGEGKAGSDTSLFLLEVNLIVTWPQGFQKPI